MSDTARLIKIVLTLLVWVGVTCVAWHLTLRWDATVLISLLYERLDAISFYLRELRNK